MTFLSAILIPEQSSVRHNLSSNRAFKKIDRGPDEKGKGALWSVDPQHEHTFEEQDARKLAEGKLLGKKGKNPAFLEPPLKRSVKGEPKGTPLPPPLTSAPLVKRELPLANNHGPVSNTPFVKAEPHVVKLEPTHASLPPAVVARAPAAFPSHPAPSSNMRPAQMYAQTHAQPSSSAPPQTSSSIPSIPPSVRLPIVVGPPPPSSDSPTNGGDPKPIILHQNTLILNPTIFAHLTPQHLRDLEALGAQKALEILQGYIVRFYKEKLRAEGGRGRGRARGKKPKNGASGSTRPTTATEGLFTTAPLPNRTPKPELQDSTSTPVPAATDAATSVASSEPPMGSLQPPEERAESPVIVIDDDDDGSDAHISKRPRLEGEDEASS